MADDEIEEGEELPQGEDVYRLAELPLNLDRVTWDPDEIGVWYFDDEEDFPHELSVFRGADLTAEEAREFKKFQEEGRDEQFIPYRRTIQFNVDDARDCGDWRILHTPLEATEKFRANPHHAGVRPWLEEAYEGNFTHARRCLIEEAEWATPPQGTKWEEFGTE